MSNLLRASHRDVPFGWINCTTWSKHGMAFLIHQRVPDSVIEGETRSIAVTTMPACRVRSGALLLQPDQVPEIAVERLYIRQRTLLPRRGQRESGEFRFDELIQYRNGRGGLRFRRLLLLLQQSHDGC